MDKPLIFEVDCSNSKHLLICEGGRLISHDHDMGAEQVLAAIGGLQIAQSAPQCVKFLDAWNNLEADPTDARLLVMLLAEETLSEKGREQVPNKYESISSNDFLPFIAGPDVRLGSSLEPKLKRALGRNAHVRAQRFRTLRQLPQEFRLQWGSVFLEAIEKGWPDTAEGSFLEGHLELLLILTAEWAFKQAAAAFSAGLPAPATWRLLAPDQPPRFQGAIVDGNADYIAELPLTWLRTVWCRGIALVDDQMILQVREGPNPREMRAKVLRFEHTKRGEIQLDAIDATIIRDDDASRVAPA